MNLLELDSIPDVSAEGKPLVLPPIEDAARAVAEDIVLPPVIIEGVLHAQSKMVIGGSSKSFKTWTQLDLAVSVATGSDWWGKKTTPGRVLYVNLEIDRPHFLKRLRTILDARGLKLEPGDADIWNLRGHGGDLTFLKPEMVRRVKDRNYSLIILDPIYKCLGDRDENKAGDIGTLMNELESLAVECRAAVVFGAHFSKGNQSGKESIDRIGGSGVFARDPDTILVMTRHEDENAYVVEATLRNFPPLAPFCVRWEYPLMKPAPELKPEDLKQPGGRTAKVPTDEEFVGIFMKDWPPDNPRFALLSSSELAWQFRERKYDKDSMTACRDRAEKKKLIGTVRGLPRNEILVGMPKAVADFKATMLVEGTRRSAKGKRSAK